MEINYCILPYIKGGDHLVSQKYKNYKLEIYTQSGYQL